jgi:glycosyltransferase involved in cell wall biosynthesis
MGPAEPVPRLVSLVPRRFEDGDFSGVPRFDFELRRALPQLESVAMTLRTRAWLKWLAWREPDTIVITGNETSLEVPANLRTIVLHHGCAQTHFERDPDWRDAKPRAFCRAQRAMYGLPNRWFLAIAEWTARQFSHHYGVPHARVLPSWVEPIERRPGTSARKVVLGDFRTPNKGSMVVARLRELSPHVEFRALKCTYQTRKAAYAEADAYLCLSLSEGGSFAVSDAEAARLPLVTTDVGNYLEYGSSRVISWQKRDDAALVVRELEAALAEPRGPCFFDGWTFERWQSEWRGLVTEVADSKQREPLLAAEAAAGDGAGGAP